jgi:type I restriction enzyme S subunit
MWGVTRLRFVLTLNPSKAEVANLPVDTDVSFIPMDAVGEYGGLRLEMTKPLASLEDGYTYFRDGDILVAKITPCFENAKGALAASLTNGVGFGTTELHVLRPGPTLEARFLFYVTLSHPFRNLGEGEMYGAGGQKRVPEEFIRDFRHPIPSLTEQRAIAAFLDRETAKIDALTTKKERLLELLEEKRTALITHAVTKGLDPSVPMKKSGVEWLGEIPAAWEVRRLRHVSPSLGVGVVVNPSQYIADDGVPFIYGSDIVEGRILADQARRISEKDSQRLPKSQLHTGDLVMVRVGAPGVTAVIREDLEGANCASVLVIRQSPRVHSDWLCYALNAHHVRSQVELVQYGAAQEQFNVSHAVNFVVAIPPLPEQQRITSVLDVATAKIDSLAAEIRKAIALLHEYRTALISAAVTGQIDVSVAAAAGEPEPATRPSR